MNRLTITARLRLTPTDAGGKKAPIRSNYCPTFDLGGSWMGNPAVNDGRIMLIARDELAPGAEGLVRIEPMFSFSEFWATVREGAVVPVHEGARVVGHVTVEKVLFVDGFTPAIATFVWKASEFCTFIQEAGKLPLDERMSGARRHLLGLYAAALGLPSVEQTDDAKPACSPEPPNNWRGFERFEIYWEVFDPYELDKPVAGSLSDDLLDVYRDVRRGLALWGAHHDASAIWEWRFSFDTHWGDHGVDALRALHRACAQGAG